MNALTKRFYAVLEQIISILNLNPKAQTPSRYVSADVITCLSHSGNQARNIPVDHAGLERRVCTVLCGSLANFAYLEELLPSQEFARMMDKYLSTCMEVVKDLGGHLNNFDGATFTVYWKAARHTDECAPLTRIGTSTTDLPHPQQEHHQIR